jgi:pimeloyl-ACP methyl ester carboxylesterase
VEERGTIRLEAGGVPYEKRFVLRFPEKAADWNGRLLIGAHGGTGGVSRSRTGNVTDTGETALDDVVGAYALEKGYAYASVDRNGIGGTREGLALTYAFTEAVRARLQAVHGRTPAQVYLAGLSAGGAIARYAAEDPAPRYSGVLIIAGGGGAAQPQLEQQAKLAALWPEVDPAKHPDRPLTHPKVKAYAEAVGTPPDARPFWVFTGARQSPETFRKTLEQYGLTGLTDQQALNFRMKDHRNNAAFMAHMARLQAENTTGKVTIPTIEVAGTYDHLAIGGILEYKTRVLAASRTASKPAPADLHRLYRVAGVWHISADDDAVPSFQYIMSQMGLSEDVQDQLAMGGTYIPTVQEALDHLDRWVVDGKTPPPDQTVKPKEPLK